MSHFGTEIVVQTNHKNKDSPADWLTIIHPRLGVIHEQEGLSNSSKLNLTPEQLVEILSDLGISAHRQKIYDDT